MLITALPTPEGYSGLVRVSSASGYKEALTGLQLSADYLHVNYEGNLAQWRTFLAERELCPPMLRSFQMRNSRPLRPMRGPLER